MTIKDFTEYLKTIGKFTKYYVNVIDENKQNVLGVYNSKSKLKRNTRFKALHKTKDFSLLVHATKNSVESEKIAQNLYDALYNANRVQSLGIDYIQLLYDEPVYIGQSSNGIFEYVIDVTIYYKNDNKGVTE